MAHFLFSLESLVLGFQESQTADLRLAPSPTLAKTLVDVGGFTVFRIPYWRNSKTDPSVEYTFTGKCYCN